MPELDTIGLLEEPPDLEPLTVPVAGYRAGKDGPEPVVERFLFRPMQPASGALMVMRATSDTGHVSAVVLWEFLEKALLPGEMERWTAFLDDPEINVPQETLIGVYQAVMAFYAGRPTLPQSGSPSGLTRTGQTSRAAARSQASTSKKRR